MDGIGRYLFNLADKISLYNELENNFNFLILEQKQYAANSILRSLEGRKNLEFFQLSVYPQSILNHFLALYIRKYKIDLFHYGQFDFPLSLSMPSIVTIHDLNPQLFRNFFSKNKILKKNYAILSNLIALKKANYTIAVSKATKSELIRLYGKKYEDKIKVIYEGIDNSFFHSSIKSSGVYEFDNIKNKFNIGKYILYVGNNRPHKNINRIIEAYKFLRKSNRIFHKFIIIGKSLPAYPSFEEIISNNKLEKDVIALHCDDELLRTFYLNANAFVYCSLSEGFGLPILESMAAGIPVITSNISSMKELSEGAAVQVDPYNIESIANGIEMTLNNIELRNKYKVLGVSRAREFSWEKCAQETINLYKIALQNINEKS